MFFRRGVDRGDRRRLNGEATNTRLLHAGSLRLRIQAPLSCLTGRSFFKGGWVEVEIPVTHIPYLALQDVLCWDYCVLPSNSLQPAIFVMH